MSATTWSKFFWADWLADPGIRRCGYAAKGLWIDMLCLAATGDPIGHLAVKGDPLTVTDIARMTGGSETEVETLIAELDRNGVFSRDRRGRIYSRRIVRDAKRSAEARKFGKQGGNPTLCKDGEKSPTLNGADKGRDKPHKPEARSQEKEEAPHRPPSGGRPSRDLFDEFWRLYPRRQGANPKEPACEKFLRYVKQGDDPADIVAGARAYAAECGKNNDIGTKFVAQAVTWLSQRRWKDYLTAAGDDPGTFVRIRSGTPQWDAWLAHMESKGEKTRFVRSRGEWSVPTEWPPKEEAA